MNVVEIPLWECIFECYGNALDIQSYMVALHHRCSSDLLAYDCEGSVIGTVECIDLVEGYVTVNIFDKRVEETLPYINECVATFLVTSEYTQQMQPIKITAVHGVVLFVEACSYIINESSRTS